MPEKRVGFSKEAYFKLLDAKLAQDTAPVDRRTTLNRLLRLSAPRVKGLKA